MSYVVDASALLAYLRRETGRDRVRAVLPTQPIVTSVNLGEVAHRLTLMHWPRDEILSVLTDLPLTVVVVDRQLALEAGLAAAVAKPYGLSFADRVCLMLAKHLDLPALTSDQKWAEAADALGVKVELIR